MNSVTCRAKEQSPSYVLGHSAQELERLTVQARLIDPITRRFFQAAGIAPGMRVLDVGSGAGDTAFLSAELVGVAGEVVGIDRSVVAVGAARARAKDKSCGNVTFIEGDPTETDFADPFDAITGRYILLFQSDPATMLRKLIKYLRRGGIVVFHEPEPHFGHSFPPVISYDKCIRLFRETMKRSGADMHMGLKLFSVFVSAGLPPPTMHMEAVIAGGSNGSEHVRLLTDIVRTVLPEMKRLGVATEIDVEIDTLAERIYTEMTAKESVIVARGEIGAWSRVDA